MKTTVELCGSFSLKLAGFPSQICTNYAISSKFQIKSQNYGISIQQCLFFSWAILSIAVLWKTPLLNCLRKKKLFAYTVWEFLSQCVSIGHTVLSICNCLCNLKGNKNTATVNKGRLVTRVERKSEFKKVFLSIYGVNLNWISIKGRKIYLQFSAILLQPLEYVFLCGLFFCGQGKVADRRLW